MQCEESKHQATYSLGLPRLCQTLSTIHSKYARWCVRCPGVLSCTTALRVYISTKHTHWAILSKFGAKITPTNFTRIHYYSSLGIIRSRIYSKSKRARAGWGRAAEVKKTLPLAVVASRASAVTVVGGSIPDKGVFFPFLSEKYSSGHKRTEGGIVHTGGHII